MPEVRKELKICEAHSEKSSIDEPHVAELKELPPHLEYAFLEGDDKLSVIIAKDLSVEEKTALITILKFHKRAIAWKLSDIKGINPEFCTHRILMEEDFELAVQHQRRVNPKIHDVIRQGVIKLLEARLIYPSLIVLGYFQIPIDPKDQEKTTFTCPYETFAYRRMPFGLCNALGTFQRCMMAIFHDMIEKTREVFMDDFSIFENSFQSCLSHLDQMLKRCEDTNLCLNWEKSHLMVKEAQSLLGLKHANFDLKTAGNHRKVQINELNELRDQAYENSLIYKDKSKRLHDSKIKNRVFNIGDRVLLFNSRLRIFSGKLKSRWSGSFTISHVFPYGTVELTQPDGPNFKVNGHRLKHYFGEDIPKLVVPDLQTFVNDH
nr:retrovirus-related Pol polyprotein from transposon 17.6 [Tanacetum cinerariifolium]